MTRWFRGTMLVVAQGSLYNTFRDHLYSDLDHHNRRDGAEFNSDMKKLYAAAKRAGRLSL